MEENFDLEAEKPKKKRNKKQAEEIRGDIEMQETPRKPTPEELDAIGAVSVTQFLRSENLGYMKPAFALYIKNKGISGRFTRKQWMDMFDQFLNAPAAPFRK